jgi:hypothetical protein
MSNIDQGLRGALAELLDGRSAHVDPRKALEGVTPALRARRPAPDVHSVWEELEHMRLAQEDILRYTVDPSWRSPMWPEGYWPEPADEVSDEAWDASVTAFFRDLDELKQLATDSSVDLTAAIPHGKNGHTPLREILLVADHNAYHLGELVQARKLLKNWR